MNTAKPATPLPWKCLIVGDKEWPAAFDRMLYQYPNGTEIVIRKDSSGGLAQHQVFIRTDERVTVYGLRFEEVQPPRMPHVVAAFHSLPRLEAERAELVAALKRFAGCTAEQNAGAATSVLMACEGARSLLAKLGEEV